MIPIVVPDDPLPVHRTAASEEVRLIGGHSVWSCEYRYRGAYCWREQRKGIAIVPSRRAGFADSAVVFLPLRVRKTGVRMVHSAPSLARDGVRGQHSLTGL